MLQIAVDTAIVQENGGDFSPPFFCVSSLSRAQHKARRAIDFPGLGTSGIATALCIA
jgi:hypothetical protein